LLLLASLKSLLPTKNRHSRTLFLVTNSSDRPTKFEQLLDSKPSFDSVSYASNHTYTGQAYGEAANKFQK
jgi:hypothetical protein